MYEDRREKFSFKNFFLTLLIVLLFIFLMLWLFPTKNYVNNRLKDSETVHDLERLSVLYDEIFANNVSRMKDAAIGYFTNERMPQKVGESKKLTLQEMYDLHLVLKMKDKDGKACDVKKSYVEMTKYTEEYRLKVNLKCGSYEDYIIVYLGCYSYCPTGICEKVVSTPSKTTAKEEKKYDNKKEEPEKYSCTVAKGRYYDKDGNVVSKSDYKKSCTTEPEPEKYSCKVVNGKYYDKDGNVVSKSEYDKSCTTEPEPEKYSCKVVNGKYYDKDGNVVSKSEYDKSCTTEPEPEKYSCKVVNGKYYDKDGNVVSKSEYDKSCTTEPEPEKYSCKVVDGKYYDKNGNVVSKSEYDKSCTTQPEPIKYYCRVVNGKYYDKNGNIVGKAEYDKSCTTQPEKKYLYEYKLVVPDSTVCPTNWSAWQKQKINATDLVKVDTKTEKEITGYDTVKVPVTTTETVKKQVTEKYIKEYVTELVKTGTKQIQVGTTTKTVTEKVAVGTIEKKTGEIGRGTVIPNNTSTYHYKLVGVPETPESCSYCRNETMYTWEVYKVETVYDVVEKKVQVPVYKTVNVYEKKEVPVYGFRTVEKEEVVTNTTYTEKKVPKYGNVTYYRSKVCTIKKGYTDIKWSESQNDTELINKGYKLTGNVKQA